ncbi:sigma-E factor negative regulatory protein [Undibacterium sp. CY18W]|uniref:Sigma-E factor negative regulatory protein n=1 Tax=Undibacterium hunanense TaxID=2762292 RepID=A0ABR6ZKW0_9BURK|nr:sigma-E factor negative regulatory protein [Undibacterium hunanense]MBC3916065.1 sigma-E factor negative regulatory protein [Undibacterium hunanense]
MDKSTNQHESISAMADGELSDAQLDSLLAGLNQPGNKDAWEIYHQIGDVLRSEELAVSFSADFSSRLSARLDAEPVILVPNALIKNDTPAPQKGQKFLGSYVAVASAAAAVVFAFILAPQLPFMHNGQDAATQISSRSAPAGNVQLASHGDSTPMSALAVNSSQNPAVMEKNAQANDKLAADMPDMLRDPRIDSYLQAHQRFSPSLNNATQYVTRANAVSAASEK